MNSLEHDTPSGVAEYGQYVGHSRLVGQSTDTKTVPLRTARDHLLRKLRKQNCRRRRSSWGQHSPTRCGSGRVQVNGGQVTEWMRLQECLSSHQLMTRNLWNGDQLLLLLLLLHVLLELLVQTGSTVGDT